MQRHAERCECRVRGRRGQQVAKPQDGALIGQADHAGGQIGELAKQGHLEEGLFHGWIDERKPLLQEMDAKHGLMQTVDRPRYWPCPWCRSAARPRP
jgi:hypothetical protein